MKSRANVGRAAEVDPAAILDGGAVVHGTAKVGANVALNGRIAVVGSADIDNITVNESAVRFAGDAFVRSENDWFTDEDDVAPHKWTVYKTSRTWPDGSAVWQACASCVKEIDLHPEMDFTDTSIYVDGAEHAPAREIQRDRVLAEIARREAL